MPKESVYDKERRAWNKFVRKMGQMGHRPAQCSKPDMIDWVECSCGWESGKYYDGFEYAWGNWKDHAQQQTQSGQAELRLSHSRK